MPHTSRHRVCPQQTREFVTDGRSRSSSRVHRRLDTVTHLRDALLHRRAWLCVALALGASILVFGDDAATRKNTRKNGRAKAKGEANRRDKKSRKRRGAETGNNGAKAKVGTQERAQSASRDRRDRRRNCDDVTLAPGADLSGCDLRGRTDLAGANLTRANLADADLREVDATGTDFSDAKLEDADFSKAEMTGARFRGARLWRTRLVGATIANADFAPSGSGRTDLFAADFTDADLRGAALTLTDVLYPHYAVICRTTMPDGSINRSRCFANG